MLGTAAACTGKIGAEPRGSAAGGPATGAGASTTGAGSASGGAGAAGTTGAGSATMTGTGAGAGGVAGTAGTGGTGGAPVVFAPSPGAYRRLTASAFRNSLRDLLQGPVTIGEHRARLVVGRRPRERRRRDRVDLRGRRRAVSNRDRRRDQPGVCRRHPPEQAARLHPEEHDRHGLLPVVRDQVRPVGLASAAHVCSGHAIRHLDRERRRDAGRRQRGHARRYCRACSSRPTSSTASSAGRRPRLRAMGSGSTRAARSPPGSRTS